MSRGLKLFALLALTLAAGAQAQDKAPAKTAPAPPPPPKLSAEGRKFIDGWIGSWTSNDTVFAMGDQKMKGSLKMSCESVSSGWGALCKGTFAAAGAPPSESTFLMAWDLATGQGHMFEVADTAEVHDHSGKWTSDKSISLVRQGKTLDGKLEKDACTATWVSAGELKFDCTGTQAGATVWTFTSTSRK
jgi:hypothetical protein